MVWQANKYSERLSARIKEGINYAKRKNKNYRHGRKRKSDYDKIIQLYHQGKNLTQIAKITGINKGSVYNALKDFR